MISFDPQHGASHKYNKITCVTGTLFQATLEKLAEQMQEITSVESSIYGIVNHFFGEQITVSGLVTGTDILEQLASKDLGDIVYIPRNMLKSDEEIFLDNVTLQQLENELKCTVRPLPLKGNLLFEAMLGKEINYE